MTELRAYLEATESSEVDWNSPPWCRAYPLLRWLQIAPTIEAPTPHGTISDDQLEILCEAVFERFKQGGELAWSSYMLQRLAQALAEVSPKGFEAFLSVVWRKLADTPLTKDIYYFSKDLGICFRCCEKLPGQQFELSRLKSPHSDARCSLALWAGALEPELWSEELIDEFHNRLKSYPW